MIDDEEEVVEEAREGPRGEGSRESFKSTSFMSSRGWGKRREEEEGEERERERRR